jgi:hypothetical protein
MRHTIIALTLALSACAPAAQEPTQAQPNTAAPSAVSVKPAFAGQEFQEKEPVLVESIAKDATPYLGKTIQVKGKVSAVCQKKGCWLELTDDTTKTRIRVLMKDHSFGVPKDSSGKVVIAEGVLSAQEVSQAEAAHLAEEAGQPIPTGPVKELRLEATGVLLPNS